MIIKLLKSYDGHPAGGVFECDDADAETLICGGVARQHSPAPMGLSASEKAEIERIVHNTRSGGDKGGGFVPGSNSVQTMAAKDFWLGDSSYSKDSGFVNFADYLCAVKSGVDPRLKGMIEGSGPDGGFLVPTEFRRDIISEILEHERLLSMLTNLPMQTNALEIPAIYDVNRQTSGLHGMQPGRGIAEATTLPQIKPTLTKIRLQLKKIGGWTPVSNELLEDSQIALSMLLPRLFAETISFDLIDQLFNGTGSGQLLGVLNASATVEVDKEESQLEGTLCFENIAKMWSRLAPSGRKNAVWCVSTSAEYALRTMTIQVGAGGAPAFVVNASNSLPQSIFGRPVMFVEQLPTIGSRGDVCVFNPQAYAFGSKPGNMIRIDTSEHVRFTTDETAFRCVCRADGQPMQSAPYTPRNGGDTMSHFVVLGERD